MVLLAACSDTVRDNSTADLNAATRLAQQINNDFAPIRKEVVHLAHVIEMAYANKNAILPKVDKSKYRMAPNGVFYKHVNDGHPALWISGFVPVDESVKEVAYLTEDIDPLLESICNKFDSVAQVYYNDRNSLNRIFPPFDVLAQYEPKMNIPSYNFYYLADATHNPERKGVWVKEPYVDPAGRGWMISTLAPVYTGDTMQGVAGLDVTIDTVARRHIENAKANVLLVDSKGIVVAGHEEMLNLFSMAPLTNHKYLTTIRQDTYRRDDFQLLKSRSKTVRGMAKALLEEDKSDYVLAIKNRQYRVTAASIPELQWTLLYMTALD